MTHAGSIGVIGLVTEHHFPYSHPIVHLALEANVQTYLAHRNDTRDGFCLRDRYADALDVGRATVNLVAGACLFENQ